MNMGSLEKRTTSRRGSLLARVQPAEPFPVSSFRTGIFWFLASEVVVFGGALSCYILFRIRNPEWAAAAQHLLLPAGIVNTVILLTSSLTMVFAHHAAEENRAPQALSALLGSLLLGALFLGIKALEYRHEWGEGFTPSASLFWAFYYLLTGLHALHVFLGMAAMAVFSLFVRKGRGLDRVEGLALYWHFVDIVWIFLFPLLYMASGK